jgi:hypothetical protein
MMQPLFDFLNNDRLAARQARDTKLNLSAFSG